MMDSIIQDDGQDDFPLRMGCLPRSTSTAPTARCRHPTPPLRWVDTGCMTSLRRQTVTARIHTPCDLIETGITAATGSTIIGGVNIVGGTTADPPRRRRRTFGRLGLIMAGMDMAGIIPCSQTGILGIWQIKKESTATSTDPPLDNGKSSASIRLPQ